MDFAFALIQRVNCIEFWVAKKKYGRMNNTSIIKIDKI